MFTLNNGIHDGKISLGVTLTSEEVSDALAAAYFDVAVSSGITPHDGMSPLEACIEKIGEEETMRQATQVIMQKFIPLAKDRAFIHTVGVPVCTCQESAQEGAEFSYDVELVLVPEIDLSDYGPATIEATKAPVDDETVVSYMSGIVAQMGGTLENGWVQENIPDCETVDDLMLKVRREFERRNDNDFQDYCAMLATKQVAQRLSEEIPAVAFQARYDETITQLAEAMGQRDMVPADIAESQDMSEEEFRKVIEEQVTEQLAQEIALDAVIRHEKLTLEKDDVARYLKIVALGREEEFQADLLAKGGMFEAKRGALHLKAGDWLVEHAVAQTA